MVDINKLFWGFRALLYKFFFRKLGFPSYIGRPIYLSGTKNVCIGKNVRIFPGLRMEVFNNGSIVIQDDVGIAQNVQITCSEIDLIISQGTVILGNSFVTNIDHEYNAIGIPVLNQHISVRRTFIGENCFIGFGAAIQAGTVLGRQCIVGAHSVVRGEFPGFCVIAGVPAKIIRQYDPSTEVWVKV